ncbi:hypothetical protein GCM10025734_22680 [Kitasatospora paranensis]
MHLAEGVGRDHGKPLPETVVAAAGKVQIGDVRRGQRFQPDIPAVQDDGHEGPWCHAEQANPARRFRTGGGGPRPGAGPRHPPAHNL